MDEAWIKEVAARHQLDPELVDALRSVVQQAQQGARSMSMGAPSTIDLTGEDFSLRSKPPITLGRYEQLGLIGEGGMGEVFRVRDTELSRSMALKALRAPLCAKSAQLTRFLEEAQVTAQLRHPGVVAVHEFGRLEDGRVYFTMEEVQGKTLSAIIRELHGASELGRWGVTDSGWTLRKMVEAFRRACETMAYSHARGVVHRDLKPSNLMLGDFGEVLVLDWGLAKVTGQVDRSLNASEGVVTERSLSQSSPKLTRVGRVFGTPSYMPPEQARGAWDEVGPASDVFSLGAVLYKLLSGRTPYRGEDAQTVLDQVLAGPPTPLEEARRGPPIPEGLSEICERAMAREVKDRYPDGGALAAAVEAWLDGSMRRQRALLRVGEAKGLLPRAEELRRQAQDLKAGALGALESVKGHDPVTDKHNGWALEDQAAQARARAALLELDARRALHDALNLDPELPEAHEALARIYRELMVQAEADRDWQRAGQWERFLRDHDRGEHQEFLEGRGVLSLKTEPAGAEAVVYRYVEQGRRLRAERVRSLGSTPLTLRLPMGDYLVVLHKEGHESVRYPVIIEREGRWDSVDQDNLALLVLPPQDSSGGEDCFVPGGWFTAGGDPLAPSALARERLWVAPFVMRRDPVTNEEYCAFLNALIDAGEGEKAQRCAPRFENFPLLKMEGRHYSCRTDLSMFDASPDKPVVLVDWHSAKAYAAWTAQKSGLPWRLPFELEWEKAARGVDARSFPWGNFLDPTWCNMRESLPERPAVASPGDFPADESPYGILGLAGNVMDWCEDLYREVGPKVLAGRVLVEPQPGSGARSLRGGHFHGVGEISRAAHRYRLDAGYRGTMIGIRLVRPCP